MKIKHINGGFWSEDNNYFGHAREATEYKTVELMPALVDDNDGTNLERVIYSDDYATYYPAGDYDALVRARAVS